MHIDRAEGQIRSPTARDILVRWSAVGTVTASTILVAGAGGPSTSALLQMGRGRNAPAIVEAVSVDERERELDAARLALVALLAVITEEQLGSVKTALQTISGLSATSQAALGELSRARGRQWLARA